MFWEILLKKGDFLFNYVIFLYILKFIGEIIKKYSGLSGLFINYFLFIM